MADKNIEIEIKFSLHNPTAVRVRLNKFGRYKGKKREIDTYFIPSHRNFLAPRYPFEWLRLRERERKYSFDYKHYHPEGARITTFCDEYQTPIEDLNSFKKILAALDFKKLVVVDKTRETWLIEGVIVTLDKIKSLGWFIELESEKNFGGIEKTRDKLFNLLGKIQAKVREEELRGYPYRLIEKEKSGSKK